jgi:hypothetical protein
VKVYEQLANRYYYFKVAIASVPHPFRAFCEMDGKAKSLDTSTLEMV